MFHKVIFVLGEKLRYCVMWIWQRVEIMIRNANAYGARSKASLCRNVEVRDSMFQMLHMQVRISSASNNE